MTHIQGLSEMPLKTLLSAKHETINVSKSYHPCTHTNMSRTRRTEAANSSSQCAHRTQERQSPAPPRVPLSGSRGDPPTVLVPNVWWGLAGIWPCGIAAVEARGAQPANYERTHDAAPVKFRAWRDKLVCFHFYFCAKVIINIGL